MRDRIYKEKYLVKPTALVQPFAESPVPSMSEQEAKATRSRSRARTLFGRKKTNI